MDGKLRAFGLTAVTILAEVAIAATLFVSGETRPGRIILAAFLVGTAVLAGRAVYRLRAECICKSHSWTMLAITGLFAAMAAHVPYASTSEIVFSLVIMTIALLALSIAHAHDLESLVCEDDCKDKLFAILFAPQAFIFLFSLIPSFLFFPT